MGIVYLWVMVQCVVLGVVWGWFNCLLAKCFAGVMLCWFNCLVVQCIVLGNDNENYLLAKCFNTGGCSGDSYK